MEKIIIKDNLPEDKRKFIIKNNCDIYNFLLCLY